MGDKHKHEAEKRAREESLNLLLQDYRRTKDKQDLETAIYSLNTEIMVEVHNVSHEYTRQGKPSHNQDVLYGHAKEFLINYFKKEYNPKQRVSIDALVKKIKHEMHLKNNELSSPTG